MDNIDSLALDDFGEAACIEPHEQGIFGGSRKRNPDPAICLQLAHQASAFSGNQRAGACISKGRSNVDGGAFSAAGIKTRDDLQDRATGEETSPACLESAPRNLSHRPSGRYKFGRQP
jgi:hypothetical protein